MFTPGGGGNHHGMFPFFEQKINFGVSLFVKSQVVIDFGVSCWKNNSLEY